MESLTGNYYTPRTLIEIQKALSSCTDPRQALLLKAKYATVLATNSHIESSRSLIAELRSANQGFEPRLSAWLMFCDGVATHSETFNSSRALESFKRSYIFASAVKDNELSSSCAAWMAHCYFALGEVERTADHLRLAFEWAEENHTGAISRASLVLADAFSWSGKAALSVTWYKLARLAASNFGDIAMQNSAIYNSAAFRVSNLTLAQIDGTPKLLEEKLAETEVDSASTLNALIGNKNSPALVPLLKAELYTALSRFDKAVECFDQYFSIDGQEGLSRYQAKLIAQKAYCDARAGNLAGASEGYLRALSLGGQQNDLDDAAVLLFRCSQTAAIVGDAEKSRELEAAAQFTISQFRASQIKAQESFLPILDLPTMAKIRGGKK